MRLMAVVLLLDFASCHSAAESAKAAHTRAVLTHLKEMGATLNFSGGCGNYPDGEVCLTGGFAGTPRCLFPCASSEDCPDYRGCQQGGLRLPSGGYMKTVSDSYYWACHP